MGQIKIKATLKKNIQFKVNQVIFPIMIKKKVIFPKKMETFSEHMDLNP